jgi:hypothetical protein
MNAMMAAMMKQAASLQENMAASGGLPPDQAAQMQAAMQQAQQMMGGAGVGLPTMPSPTAKSTQESKGKVDAQKEFEEPIFSVDKLKRGHVRFNNPDGRLVTLIVFDRSSGKELLKKEYPGGIIDEYVNLGQYKLPLEQIGVVIRNISGEVLANLEPKDKS